MCSRAGYLTNIVCSETKNPALLKEPGFLLKFFLVFLLYCYFSYLIIQTNCFS